MSAGKNYIRHGNGAVRPYLYGYPDLLPFVKAVFGAREVENVTTPGGVHVEVQIDDAVVVLELGEEWQTKPTGSIYVYVPDVDVAYARALQHGATPIDEPENKPYGERGAGVRDSFGNVWYIGTYVG